MSPHNKQGFTIVELLVVITIIGILMSMVLPAANSIREAARRAQCVTNQSQIAKAAMAYAAKQGKYPPQHEWAEDASNPPVWGQFQTWVFTLMPELGRNDLFQAGASGPVGIKHVDTYWPLMICPSDQPDTTTGFPLNYVVNAGRPNNWGNNSFGYDWPDNGVWLMGAIDPADTKVPLRTITLGFIQNGDGTANTLTLAENLDAADANNPAERNVSFLWQSTTSWPKKINEGMGSISSDDNARPSSNHPGGVVMAFVAGNARFFQEDLDYTVYARLMSSNGIGARDPGQNNPTSPAWQANPVNIGEIK